MYPHERSLVKRLEGKPFALIGVNSDVNKDICSRRTKEEKITWRSFWNGGRAPAARSPTEWNVHGWPTLYVHRPQGRHPAQERARRETDR